MPTFETYLTRDNSLGSSYTFPVWVTYDYYPASRGARDTIAGIRGAGPPLEPDEPEHIDILTVLNARDGRVELSDDEYNDIENEILDELHDDGDY